MSRHLVTLEQAADLRPWCTVRYGRRLVAERRIPFHKVGGRVLVDLAELDAYAETGRVVPPTPHAAPPRQKQSPRDGGLAS